MAVVLHPILDKNRPSAHSWHHAKRQNKRHTSRYNLYWAKRTLSAPFSSPMLNTAIYVFYLLSISFVR